MFTKKDLKNMDFVEYQNGKIRMVVDDTLVGQESFGLLRDYSDALINIYSTSGDLDIMKVYRGVYTFDNAICGTVVFDRDRDVAEEMTLEEVCKALGKNIKIVKE